MRKLIVSILIFPVYTFGFQNIDPNTRSYTPEEAFSITTGAILQRPDIQLIMRHSEDWGWRQVEYMGLNPDLVRITATLAAPLVYRKVSTKGLHFHWEPLKALTIRPDYEYYMDSFAYNATLNIAWEF